ncbi:MAG: beta-lactamase family protein [Solirubrobacteraceae bacterium MAG38_C4-C5]|nr:beta-lactamase family protein [Candidatus Siliceabacter maunaloa]
MDRDGVERIWRGVEGLYRSGVHPAIQLCLRREGRGDIHFGDRVAEYVPEHGSHGKHRITIGHILSHRAGVPNLPSEALDLDLIDDSDTILRLLCDARPSTRPGKLLSYHAISGAT